MPTGRTRPQTGFPLNIPGPDISAASWAAGRKLYDDLNALAIECTLGGWSQDSYDHRLRAPAAETSIATLYVAMLLFAAMIAADELEGPPAG